MVIRAAVKDDIFNISRLYALSLKKAYVGIVPQGYLDRLRDDAWTIKFEDDMENGWLKYNVAVENGCIVGCIAFGKPCSGQETGTSGNYEIQSLYVHPDYFRNGIGSALMEYAFSKIRESGGNGAYLWVADKNDAAKNFYNKMGFEITARKLEVEMDGEIITDYMAVKKLDD